LEPVIIARRSDLGVGMAVSHRFLSSGGGKSADVRSFERSPVRRACSREIPIAEYILIGRWRRTSLRRRIRPNAWVTLGDIDLGGIDAAVILSVRLRSLLVVANGDEFSRPRGTFDEMRVVAAARRSAESLRRRSVARSTMSTGTRSAHPHPHHPSPLTTAAPQIRPAQTRDTPTTPPCSPAP
jgi:hypothetical protein